MEAFGFLLRICGESKVNAYELADELETRIATQGFEITKQSANMLRQQADRIAELEKDLALKTRDRDVFCDFTLAYEKRIEELEKLVEEMKYEKSSGVYDVSSKPVAWITEPALIFLNNYACNYNTIEVKKKQDAEFSVPLYTHPVKQLSNDRIREIGDELKLQNGGVLNWIDFARAIIKASRGEE